jgi:hypothetical protein
LLVKCVHIVTVYVQSVVLGVIDFSKLLDIEWNWIWHFTIIVHINIIVVSGLDEGCEEFSQLGLNVGGIDVSTPQDLGVGGHFSASNHLVDHLGIREL